MEFLSRFKNIFLVLAFILTTIIIGYLIYILFFKPNIVPTTKPAAQTTNTPAGTGLPESAAGGKKNIVSSTTETTLPSEQTAIAQIPEKAATKATGSLTETTEFIASPTLGATLSSNGSDIQYYDPNSGKFNRIDKNGDSQELSDKIFHNVEKVTWSPDKNKAILEYPDGAKIVYDFGNQKQITLPKHWKDFDFSPDGRQIVLKSIGLDPDNRWLAIASDDGANVRPLEALGEKDSTVYPAWSPNNQIVAMYTEGKDFDSQEVYFVGLNNENFKSTVVEGRGFEPKWSPQGDKLLYSVYSSSNDMKPNLWIVNAQGDNIGTGRNNLNIETWANKCTFANAAELYCAVPENLPEGAGLFPELAATTKDRLYKIDISTGLKKLIAVPDGDYTMSDLMISSNGYYLYFTDNNTKQIRKIKLK
jgi:hypothetical protein